MKKEYSPEEKADILERIVQKARSLYQARVEEREKRDAENALGEGK